MMILWLKFRMRLISLAARGSPQAALLHYHLLAIYSIKTLSPQLSKKKFKMKKEKKVIGNESEQIRRQPGFF